MVGRCKLANNSLAVWLIGQLGCRYPRGFHKPEPMTSLMPAFVHSISRFLEAMSGSMHPYPNGDASVCR